MQQVFNASSSTRKADSRRYLRWMILLLVQVALLAWLFRANWGNGFSHVFGDRYDSLIETALLEHWYNVVRGLAHWNSVHYFYPYAKTLGYNDGYLAYGLIYSCGRLAGADPLLAAMLVNLAMKVIAFLGFYWFGCRVLRLRFGYAVLGGVIFTVSNNVVVHLLHAQLLTVGFVPPAATLLYLAVRALLDNDAAGLRRYGACFALLYGVWALTAYYLLWFFSFYTLVVLVFLVLLQRRALPRWSAISGPTRRALVLVLALQVATLLPFLSVYLPKAAETGMHPYQSVLTNALGPFDILNIGTLNYVWGDAVYWLHARIDFPLNFSENQMGMPPLLVLAFLAGSVWLCCRRVDGVLRLVLAGALAALAIWLLLLKINGVSAYGMVYHLVPGAKGVRVISRWMVFLVFPVTAVAMVFLSAWQQRRRLAAGALLALCTLLLVGEQLNRADAVFVDRRPVMALLTAVPAPPAICRAFYVLDPRPARPGDSPPEVQYYRSNVDAMLIAEYINLPTINGFSTFNPPDWRFDFPARQDYQARVDAYAAHHDLKNLCGLDLEAMRWTVPDGQGGA
ncbi:hypothetical protein [Burkholderia sp. LMU1-1-1.1]|jgi:hypothetical protein|uniref:hypothetical protein n=1 Tax=Burkholderia sp. LMU1-1-1.1 TaxID=3135266 RepID=UPI0034399285